MRFGKDDRYEFDPKEDRLGESPHSEVFKAWDTQLERHVALKVLRPNSEIDPAAEERFQREARNTGQMNHPNIAMVYDFSTLRGEEYGTFDGSSYIAMEHLEGRTLDQVLKARDLTWDEAVHLAEQVLSALAAVHSRGLIHRDLKPANVMLLPDGQAKLLDFGISRVKGETSITQEGILVGTVLYMSPEQVRGADLDERSDLFSVGAVLYHVMTRTLPFPGRSFPEVCMAILDGRPARPSLVRSGFPLPLESFLLTLMAPDRERRYADADAAIGALLEVRAALGRRGRGTPAAAVRGRLVLEPLEVAGDENAALVARGVETDLASVLARTTQLELVRAGSGRDSKRGDLVLRGRLTVSGAEGALDYRVVRRGAAAPEEDRTLWADRIVHDDPNDFGLQGQLVGTMARTMRRRLAEQTRTVAHGTRAHADEAIALARRAHEVMHRGTSRHVLKAMVSFRAALEADPACALARAGLAEAHVLKYLMWDGDDTYLTKAQEYAHQALDLDDACAEAHTSLGFAYSMGGRGNDARREYSLAIHLDHSEWLAHRLLGAQYARRGNYAEAIGLLQRAIDLEPTHLAAYDHLYSALDRADRYEDALILADRGVRRARERLDEVPDDQDTRLHLALLLARRGSAEDARGVAAHARERFPKDGYTLFHLACVHALLGDVREALDLLKAAQARSYYIHSELDWNTDLDSLRGNREFQLL